MGLAGFQAAHRLPAATAVNPVVVRITHNVAPFVGHGSPR